MMIVSIPPDGVKPFMNHLLREQTFDGFLFRKASIESFARFEADAPTAKEDGEAPPPCPWARMRPYIHGLIKGGGAVGAMKIVLAYPPDKAEEAFGASSLALNVLFDQGRAVCTMGGAAKSFTEQKALDEAWGAYVKRFLSENNIEYTEE